MSLRTQLYALSTAAAAPSIQQIPATAAEATSRAGLTFTDWVRTDLASGNLVTSAGNTLTAGGGPVRYQRTVPGWDGASMTASYRAIEFAGTGSTDEAFAASSALTYALLGSRVYVLALRCLRPPAAARGIFGNRTSSAAAHAGIEVRMSTAGTINAVVADGTTNAQANSPGVLDELDSICNGALQWVAVKVNLTTNLVTVFAQGSNGTPVAIGGGGKTSAEVFRLGGQPTLFSCELLQVLAFGVLNGADAEAFGLSHLAALDNWCKVPAGIQGHVRNHTLGPVVGRDASGARVQLLAGSITTTSKLDFAHAYAPAATTPGSVGMLLDTPGTDLLLDGVTSAKRRNRLKDTDNLASASWTATNLTAVKNQGEDPAGFAGAARLTASAAGGTLTQDFTGEASEAHTVSVFAQRDQAGDVLARLSLKNSSGGGELAGLDIVIGATRERYSLEVPASAVGAISTLQWCLTITNSGDKVFATFAQAEWKELSQYQPQRGTLIDRDDIEWRPRCTIDPIGGRIEVTCVGFQPTVDSHGCFVFDTSAGTAFASRLLCVRDAASNAYPNEWEHYDNRGRLVAQVARAPAVHTAELLYTYDWDSRQPVPGSTVAAVGVVGSTSYPAVPGVPVPATRPWTPGTDGTVLYLGMRHTSTAHLRGIITSAFVYGAIEIPAVVVAPDIARIDHVELGLSRLPAYLRGKRRWAELLAACLRPLQDVEDTLLEIMRQRNLEDAVGAQLDQLGALVREPRAGLEDVAYRRRIRARIARNRSQGLVEDVIRIARLIIFNGAASITVEQQNVATVVVRVGAAALDSEIAADVISFLRDSVSAGVRVIVESSPAAPAATFTFDGPAGLGFPVPYTIDLAEYGAGRFSTVLGVKPDVDAANLPFTFELVADAGAPTAGALDDTWPAISFTFQPSMTEIADLEAAIRTSAWLYVVEASTFTDKLEAGDDFAAVATDDIDTHADGGSLAGAAE